MHPSQSSKLLAWSVALVPAAVLLACTWWAVRKTSQELGAMDDFEGLHFNE